ncbi:MAG: FAD-dependent oxidoreductase, partial [Planctomycetia bacterium]|nr:FAD-dependent oxidoreductase [Planctomycetia bacterium]
VRTRNWVSPWTSQYAPGKFQLGVDGKWNATTFGTQSNPWAWQQGEDIVVDRNGAELEVRLHDLTGFDGRVDAICFTQDKKFIPPNAKDQLAPLRRQAQNVPDEIPLASDKPFDLVVVGGGLAGICTAISAARSGLSVALVQDRPVLGGNHSSEIRVNLTGNINRDPYPNLGNLTRFMGTYGGGNGRSDAEHYQDDVRLDMVKAEKSIQLFLCTRVNQVETEINGTSRHIRSVVGQNIATGKRLRFVGHLFVDCTGDANVGYLAGADWRTGREARSETGESFAPRTGDKMTMGASVLWSTVVTDKPTTFPVLPWAIQFSPETIQPLTHGEWTWETGMKQDQVNDIEKIRDNGLRAAYGHWSYMKNFMTDEWKTEVANRQFGWVSATAGKRESRRLMGDYILCEQDIVNHKVYDDAAVTATWPIDLHFPHPENAKHFPGQEFRASNVSKRCQPYPIPYRCFYSRNVNNLFMAGRQISVTHVALGSTRVMRTHGMMGEMVGMAAAVCRKHDCLPRDVYPKYFTELKARMEKGIAPPSPALALRTIPAWTKNPGKNYALDAKAAASDTKKDYDVKYINDGKCDVTSNAGRWVSNAAPETANRHWVSLTFDKPVEINAFVAVGGTAGSDSPNRNFVLQYEKNGVYIDIPETIIIDNQVVFAAMKFPKVKSKSFRLHITYGTGRLWELSLYNIPE